MCTVKMNSSLGFRRQRSRRRNHLLTADNAATPRMIELGCLRVLKKDYVFSVNL